ncbi:MAG: tetratricopeptide repeat protein [Alphaproteobacteria bacterium]|nr:tetratricopeptide repeat protein [Alphaproteobacteria bacterium]
MGLRMEKSKKLKRYSRKDYTQLVDFPVEIVGRDGIVRRYSFEASVRLYQRRIASAPSRYRDTEVVDAEVRHCQLRIEQLRKSYFHRYGWSAIRSDRGPGVLAGQFAGEVAAFLRRFYGDSVDPEHVEVAWIQDADAAQVYFVQLSGTEERYLLYLYRFRHHGPCQGRESFFDFLRMLRNVRGEGVERLVAFHHTADCGLVLTGTGDLSAESRRAMDGNADAEDSEGGIFLSVARPPGHGAYEAGIRLLGEGEPEGALARFEQALAAEPFRRQVALAVAVVADSLGRPEVSETAALMASHYLPGDPVFDYHLGLARLRQGDGEDADRLLSSALEQVPSMFPARLMRGLLALRDRRYGRAIRDLGHAVLDARPEDGDARQLAEGLLRTLLWSRGALVGAALLALIGLALVASVSWLAGAILLGLAVSAFVVAVAARTLARRRIEDDLVRLRPVPPESLGARGNQSLDELLV